MDEEEEACGGFCDHRRQNYYDDDDDDGRGLAKMMRDGDSALESDILGGRNGSGGSSGAAGLGGGSHLRQTAETATTRDGAALAAAISDDARGEEAKQQQRADYQQGPPPPKVPELSPNDWERMLSRYFNGNGWIADDEYAMLGDDLAELNTGETKDAVANADMVVRPVAVALEASREGRVPAPTWPKSVEARMLRDGSRLSGTQLLRHPSGKTVFAKVFHIHWRHYMYVVLDRDAPDASFLGYHYLCVSDRDARNNGCE